jgi:DNA repair protein RadD
MKLIPRDYQLEAVYSIFRYFESGKKGNPVVALPTGTGKSVVLAHFLELVYRWYPGQKTMMLTHVKELIDQNFEKLLTMWPQAPAGIYSAGLKRRDTKTPIVFGGIGSVVKRAKEFGKVDLLIVDECHLISLKDKSNYRKFIADLLEINPNLRVIGLTATPWRLGQGLITEGENALFTDICFDLTDMKSFNWLINQGYLCPVTPTRQKHTLNVDGVGIHGGEFVMKDVQAAVNKYDITEAAIRESMEVAGDRKKWLVFTTGIEHATDTAEIMNNLGITTKAVHSKLTATERDEILHEFKYGDLQAVTNNNVLTTGFDHPGIDLIIGLRPTMSPVLWVQMLGRGTRPLFAEGFNLQNLEGRLLAIQNSDKQNCLVLDFAANSHRVGPINDPVIPRPKGKGTGTAPVKDCDGCPAIIHASLRICPECGHEFIFKIKIDTTASSKELIKQDLPIMVDFKVDTITYTIHKKKGSNDMIKVSYYCGIKMFTEYVCVEHRGPARARAQDWWNFRTDNTVDSTMPSTAVNALYMCNKIIKPTTSIRVWVNKRYPEILICCVDGTHFGTETAAKVDVGVTVYDPFTPLEIEVTKEQQEVIDEFDGDEPMDF